MSEYKMNVSVCVCGVWLYQGSAQWMISCVAPVRMTYLWVPFILWFTSSIIRSFFFVLRSRFCHACMFDVLFVFVDAFAKREMCWIVYWINSFASLCRLFACAHFLMIQILCMWPHIVFYYTTPSDPFRRKSLVQFHVAATFSHLFLPFFLSLSVFLTYSQYEPYAIFLSFPPPMYIYLFENSIQLCCFAVFHIAKRNTIFIRIYSQDAHNSIAHKLKTWSKSWAAELFIKSILACGWYTCWSEFQIYLFFSATMAENCFFFHSTSPSMSLFHHPKYAPTNAYFHKTFRIDKKAFSFSILLSTGLCQIGCKISHSIVRIGNKTGNFFVCWKHNFDIRKRVSLDFFFHCVCTPCSYTWTNPNYSVWIENTFSAMINRTINKSICMYSKWNAATTMILCKTLANNGHIIYANRIFNIDFVPSPPMDYYWMLLEINVYCKNKNTNKRKRIGNSWNIINQMSEFVQFITLQWNWMGFRRIREILRNAKAHNVNHKIPFNVQLNDAIQLKNNEQFPSYKLHCVRLDWSSKRGKRNPLNEFLCTFVTSSFGSTSYTANGHYAMHSS